MQTEPVDPVLQGRTIQQFSGHGKHRPNVTQVFIGAAFAIIFKLPQDDIFRRGETDGVFANGITAGIAKSPGMKVIRPAV